MAHKFVIADVFTDRPFGGNQLAVFPDARGISDKSMQAYAREINFAETTFVLPPENPKNTVRVRIFSPRVELPFAGHPTVGTAAVLSHLGVLRPTGAVFEEGIGPVGIELEPGTSSIVAHLVLEPKLERPATKPSAKAAADVLSLDQNEVLSTWFASVGLPFCFVHLRSNEAVDRAVLNRADWTERFAKSWAAQLFFFAGSVAGGGPLYARMFAPAFGIEEDPATGSAAAALAATIAAEDTETDCSSSWTISQGMAMGRPSRIEASAEKKNGKLIRVAVGGPTVIVGEGLMTA